MLPALALHSELKFDTSVFKIWTFSLIKSSENKTYQILMQIIIASKHSLGILLACVYLSASFYLFSFLWSALFWNQMVQFCTYSNFPWMLNLIREYIMDMKTSQCYVSNCIWIIISQNEFWVSPGSIAFPRHDTTNQILQCYHKIRSEYCDYCLTMNGGTLSLSLSSIPYYLICFCGLWKELPPSTMGN